MFTVSSSTSPLLHGHKQSSHAYPDECSAPINKEFFDESVTGIGSPGGAAQVGPVDKDHPFVTAFAAPE